ncbi:LAG1 longevity assurance homolog 3 [Klebsormidium nitens]|uniref:LAG1 longevity assurance homolog 3 n=1 Tax=Klebsormidium nitens TaxID=105231 RepID=A0A1Y1I8N0_KLENI|nr:LAG1 longevity assurance homolog 3 [Klebsormidium nitens]|eukprot:GAQ85769.1 LAG1 longevity assurance homolog 3 [Klebsormidium nitens]
MVDSSSQPMEAGFELGAFNVVHLRNQLSDWLAQLLLSLLGHSDSEGPHGLARWRQRSLPVVADLQLALLLALLLPALRWALECTVFDSAARSALARQRPPASRVGQERAQLAVTKYKESAWRCCFYGAVWLYGLTVTLAEGWPGRDTRALWDGWPHHTVTYGVKVFYMLELSYYLFGIYAVGASFVAPAHAWEVRRKDSLVMLTHHLATTLLLAYSYLHGFVRIGALVLLAHDLSDVLLEGAKLAKYAGRELAASLTFAAFALSFFALRLVYYPAVLIYSASFEAPALVGPLLTWPMTLVFYYVFNTALLLVLVLHCYWFLLILRIAAKQIASGGKVDDVRSDSDDD